MNISFLKLLIVFSLIVIILANIELYVNEKQCVLSITLSKDSNTLLPKNTGFMDPIYVYNSKHVKRRDLNYQPGYNEKLYVKKTLDEHIASKLSQPFKELTKTLTSIPKSKTPINDLYASVGKGGEIINLMTPLSYNSVSNYKMLTSMRDNANGFVSGNKLYIIKN